MMIFMPLSQFVAVWLIRKVHSVVLRAVLLYRAPLMVQKISGESSGFPVYSMMLSLESVMEFRQP